MHHFSAHRVTLSQNAPYALNAPSSYVSSAAGVNPVAYRQWQTQEPPRKNQQNLKGKTTYFVDGVKYVYYNWRNHENV